MKKKFKIIFSLLFCAALVFNASYLNLAVANGQPASGKITDELNQIIKDASDEEEIPVYIWFDDIDIKRINQQAEQNVGFTQQYIEESEQNIPNVDTSIFDLDDEHFSVEFKRYIEETREQRMSVLNMQNELIFAQRQLAKNAYEEYNNHQLAELRIPDESIIYVSVFSPVVIASLNKKDIFSLSDMANVVELGYKNNTSPEEAFAYALPAVQADYTRNTLGFDGSGVKIGMYDAGSVGSHSELSSSNINNISGLSVSPHSTNVARILVGSNGVAPNAILYANASNVSAEAGIEALIAYGVCAINVSMTWGTRGTNYYTNFEQWFDHIAYQHNVTIVAVAGNSGVTTNIPQPGLACNLITVGGTNPKGTTNRSDDTLYNESTTDGSCGGNGGTNGCAKPDIIAPAFYSGMGYGTSYAAPTVTGIIAQMVEYKPTLATKPAVIKAVLTSSTDKKVLPGGSNAATEAWAGPLTAQQGAGQVNARLCMYILGQNNYAQGTMSTGPVTKTFSVTSSDTFIRYNVTWIRRNTASSDHTNPSSTAAIAPNLKLQLFNPSGSSVGVANDINTSVELVHFNTNSVTGTFSAKVTRVDSGTNTFTYAVAWR